MRIFFVSFQALNISRFLKLEIKLRTITSIKKHLGDYDRLTDWIRPLARGLAIYIT